MSEDTRRAIVDEAKTWLGCRYHHAAGVKNAGVDCLMLIVRSGQVAGVVPQDIKIPHYSPQFNLHRGVETYLQGLYEYTREIEGNPEPGDIAIWKFGRVFAHAAIVLDWPLIIHASAKSGRVLIEDVDSAAWLKFIDDKGGCVVARPVKFLSLW